MELYCGDSAEVLKTFAPCSIDLTVTSPPYDNLRTYNGFTFDFEAIAKELYRVTKDGGVVVWVVGDATVKGSETGTSFRQALYFKEIGFNLHDTMIYRKKCYAPMYPNTARYAQTFEYMFILSKGKPQKFNELKEKKSEAAKTITASSYRRGDARISKQVSNANPLKAKTNIWDYYTGALSRNDRIAFTHPAIFPEQLAADHILSWSNEGDTVLDCFMGSGTTGKMATLLNRNFIGIEISAEYLEIARQRVAAASSPAPLFATAQER